MPFADGAVLLLLCHVLDCICVVAFLFESGFAGFMDFQDCEDAEAWCYGYCLEASMTGPG